MRRASAVLRLQAQLLHRYIDLCYEQHRLIYYIDMTNTIEEFLLLKTVTTNATIYSSIQVFK